MERNQLENIILATGFAGAITLLFMAVFNQQQLSAFFPEKGQFFAHRLNRIKALDDLSLELTRIQLYCEAQKQKKSEVFHSGARLETLSQEAKAFRPGDSSPNQKLLDKNIHDLSNQLQTLKEEYTLNRTIQCIELTQNTNELVNKEKSTLWQNMTASSSYALEQAKRNFITRTVILIASLILFALSFLLAARYRKQRDKAESNLQTVNGELSRTVQALTLSIDNERATRERKEAIVSVVSHDLRTPLCALLHTMEMLADNIYGNLPEQAKGKVAQSEKNIGRLITLINKLLDTEKQNASLASPKFENVDLIPILSEALELVSGLAERSNIVFVVNTQASLAIIGDKQSLGQVLVNLLSNAIKYSPHDSKIFVEATDKDSFLEFRLKDSGPGIEADIQTKIFEKFQQGEKSPYNSLASTGLGLAICKEIIENHGGTIGVLSTVGNGSTFWFKLPLSPV